MLWAADDRLVPRKVASCIIQPARAGVLGVRGVLYASTVHSTGDLHAGEPLGGSEGCAAPASWDKSWGPLQARVLRAGDTSKRHAHPSWSPPCMQQRMPHHGRATHKQGRALPASARQGAHATRALPHAQIPVSACVLLSGNCWGFLDHVSMALAGQTTANVCRKCHCRGRGITQNYPHT